MAVSLQLAQNVGVSYAPAVAAVSDGRLYHFTGTISVSEIRKFLKTILPNVIVVSASLFHGQYYVCVCYSLQMYHYFSNLFLRPLIGLIVCSSYSIPSLHVLLNAKRHRQFIDFGYVSLSDDNSVALASWLGLSKYIQTAILLFKDRILQYSV